MALRTSTSVLSKRRFSRLRLGVLAFSVEAKPRCSHHGCFKANFLKDVGGGPLPESNVATPKKRYPNQKLTLLHCQELANDRKGDCLSNEYKNVREKMKWRCEFGHEWEATFFSIRQGSWCPHCNGGRRLSLRDAQKLAESREGKCLSKKYVNGQTKLHWQCKYGHEWQSAYSTVKSHNSWCPVCALNSRWTPSIEDARGVGQLLGWECLSTKIKTSKSLLWWKCDKGHKFKFRYIDVRNGDVSCPFCVDELRYHLSLLENGNP